MSLLTVTMQRLRCRRCRLDADVLGPEQAETVFDGARLLGMSEGLELAAEMLRPFLTGPETASRNLLLGRMRTSVREWDRLAAEQREEIRAIMEKAEQA